MPKELKKLDSSLSRNDAKHLIASVDPGSVSVMITKPESQGGRNDDQGRSSY